MKNGKVETKIVPEQIFFNFFGICIKLFGKISESEKEQN